MRQALARLGLEQYADRLVEAGFDTRERLDLITPQHLRRYGVRDGHALTILDDVDRRRRRSFLVRSSAAAAATLVLVLVLGLCRCVAVLKAPLTQSAGTCVAVKFARDNTHSSR